MTPILSPLAALTPLQRALIAVVFIAPVIVTAGVLPTFHSDTAEAILWGRSLPLFGTHKHPPVMALFGYLVGLLPHPSAWHAVLLQLLLNAVAVGYCAAIAGFALPPERRAALVLGLTLSLLMTLWPVTGFALNADIVPIPFWAGAVYHLIAVRHAPQRRWHWLMAAIMLSLALLTKYYAVLLVLALVIASVSVRDYRVLWRGPWPWLTVGAVMLMFAPHALWVWQNPDKLGYVADRMQAHELGYFRLALRGLVALVISLVLFGLPYFSLLSLAQWRHDRAIRLEFDWIDRNADARFVALTLGVVLVISVALILLGLEYKARFTAPAYSLMALTWMALLPVSATAERFALKASFVAWGLVYAAIPLIYLVFSSHSYAQEPAPVVAERLRAAWTARYSCGPAYMIGDYHPAQVIAVSYDKRIAGLPINEYRAAPWFRPERLAGEGAIYLVWFETSLPQVKALLPPGTAIEQMTLPLLRTWRPETQTFWYAFAPPADCPPKS